MHLHSDCMLHVNKFVLLFNSGLKHFSLKSFCYILINTVHKNAQQSVLAHLVTFYISDLMFYVYFSSIQIQTFEESLCEYLEQFYR